jgi:hypothetical protein
MVVVVVVVQSLYLAVTMSVNNKFENKRF